MHVTSKSGVCPNPDNFAMLVRSLVNASHVVGLVTSIHGKSCPALCFCDDMTVLDVLGYPNPELDGVL